MEREGLTRAQAVRKAGELVAGKERALEVGVGGDPGVVGVGEDGLQDGLGPAMLAEEGDADEGMIVERGVAFVVHVVEQAGAAVGFSEAGGLVPFEAEACGFTDAVAFGAAGYREAVLDEGLAGGPLAEQGFGVCCVVGFGHDDSFKLVAAAEDRKPG